MKNWKIAGVIALSTVSLIGVGFSAWVFGYEGPQRVSVQVNADDVVYTTVDLEGIGFALDNDPFESFKYVTDTSDGKNYADGPVYYTIQATIDLSKLKDVNFIGENYLKIIFGYVGGTKLVKNVVDSLEIYPTNYENYNFQAEVYSASNVQSIFYFPIKSDKEMSLYDLASLDSTTYKVPITFKFEVSDPDIDELLSSGQNVSIQFSMSDKIE